MHMGLTEEPQHHQQTHNGHVWDCKHVSFLKFSTLQLAVSPAQLLSIRLLGSVAPIEVFIFEEFQSSDFTVPSPSEAFAALISAVTSNIHPVQMLMHALMI